MKALNVLLTILLVLIGPMIPEVEASPDETGTGWSIFRPLFVQYRHIFGGVLQRRCVYYPSCSRYAAEAVNDRGPLFGTMMALERWTRCTAAAYGYDDYERTGEGKLDDPVGIRGEVTCWGSSLLPF